MPGRVSPVYLPGKVSPVYVHGTVSPVYVHGRVSQAYLPGKVSPVYLPGKVSPVYLPRRMSPVRARTMERRSVSVDLFCISSIDLFFFKPDSVDMFMYLALLICLNSMCHRFVESRSSHEYETESSGLSELCVPYICSSSLFHRFVESGSLVGMNQNPFICLNFVFHRFLQVTYFVDLFESGSLIYLNQIALIGLG